MMDTMIPPQVGMRLRTLQKEALKKRKGPNKKLREERRDNVTILLQHLCFKVAP